MIIGALDLVVLVCVIAVGAYSYYIVCMIITVCLSQSMLASDIGFLVYATHIIILVAFVSFLP